MFYSLFITSLLYFFYKSLKNSLKTAKKHIYILFFLEFFSDCYRSMENLRQQNAQKINLNRFLVVVNALSEPEKR